MHTCTRLIDRSVKSTLMKDSQQDCPIKLCVHTQCTGNLQGTGLIWHMSNTQFVHVLITLLRQQAIFVIVHD